VKKKVLWRERKELKRKRRGEKEKKRETNAYEPNAMSGRAGGTRARAVAKAA
jgi:hypothetical protein